jgi:anaerobic ribonucleoside-triphosphate reductase activating protein
MKYYQYTIVFQEVPDEVTLAFEITNCPHKCPGCHSPHLIDDIGIELTLKHFQQIVDKYFGMITNVAFFGGEQYSELIDMLAYVKQLGLKTTLWTGSCAVNQAIMPHLNYLKTGPYVEELGGLQSSTTNQQYINLDTGEPIRLA